MNNYIKATYKRNIFESNNGYIIGLFKVLETNLDSNVINKQVTVTGYFSNISIDETIIIYGEFVTHPRYGYQFNSTGYEVIIPSNEDAIISFLSSDLFKGIGVSLAKKIVDKFKSDTIDVITDTPEQLYLIPKISKKKIDLIVDVTKKHVEYSKINIYLSSIGFSNKESLMIYNVYKNKTLDQVNNNIYDLYENVLDLSLKKIDQAAFKLEIDRLDKRRLKAIIIYIIKDMCFKRGDTYLLINQVYDTLIKSINLSYDYDQFINLIEELVTNNRLYLIDDKIVLSEYFEAEYFISEKLKLLNNKNDKVDKKKLNKIVTLLEGRYDISYNDEQKEAIYQSLSNDITIITGGPGTGKTTIIKSIVESYKELYKLSDRELDDNIKLLAPTGRASKRLEESTLRRASTIHRFLKWNKDDNSFRVNENNRDFSHLIIVDEISMVDILLMNSLLKGLTNNIKLILVGDYNQLPSVMPGDLLKDIIDSNQLNVVSLNKLYRQSDDSYINVLASSIKEDNVGDFISSRSDYMFVESDRSQIKEHILRIYSSLINMDISINDIQILVPKYKGENGIDNINIMIQELVNPRSNQKSEYKYADVIFREKDKVIELVNMPDEGVYNGDIGIIESITTEDNKTVMYVDFDSNIVRFNLKDFNNLKHGYAISIHKSQGGEFNNVIIPMSLEYSRMLYKKLIYTGITRAKNNLIIVGSTEAFLKSITTKEEHKRNTLLLDNLKKSD